MKNEFCRIKEAVSGSRCQWLWLLTGRHKNEDKKTEGGKWQVLLMTTALPTPTISLLYTVGWRTLRQISFGRNHQCRTTISASSVNVVSQPITNFQNHTTQDPPIQHPIYILTCVPFRFSIKIKPRWFPLTFVFFVLFV